MTIWFWLAREDAYDLQLFDEEMEAYLQNPVTYTHDELCSMLA